MTQHVRVVDGLRELSGSAKAGGYRMPGEFERVEAVWLTYPHNEETWPGCMEEAREQYDFFMSQVARFARVELTGNHKIKTNDSWIRDYGPIFVVNEKGELGCHDFVFNGWGGKYGGEYGDDDVVPQRVAKELGVPIWVHDMVLEGGSIDVNGRGTVMTTEQCLFNPRPRAQRNPGMSREEIEKELHEALGTWHVIWLPGGIIGDDTDGHVDDIARFVSAERVVAIRAPKGHADYEMLEANWKALRQARLETGHKIELVELPVPGPGGVNYKFPADRFGPGGVNPCPASYANFLMVNEAVLVPVFGQTSDERALRVMEEACGDRVIVPVRSEFLVVGLGALHCLSQQQPFSGR
ncbi:MAG: agmatine deiminase family protein [Phycisphaeraceae bacterium]